MYDRLEFPPAFRDDQRQCAEVERQELLKFRVTREGLALAPCLRRGCQRLLQLAASESPHGRVVIVDARMPRHTRIRSCGGGRGRQPGRLGLIRQTADGAFRVSSRDPIRNWAIQRRSFRFSILREMEDAIMQLGLLYKKRGAERDKNFSPHVGRFALTTRGHREDNTSENFDQQLGRASVGRRART